MQQLFKSQYFVISILLWISAQWDIKNKRTKRLSNLNICKIVKLFNIDTYFILLMLEIVHSASGIVAGKLLGRQDTVAPEKSIATNKIV